jgi:hypothetical protein
MLDPQKQTLFMMHCQAHQQAIYVNMNFAARAQGMMGQQIPSPGVQQQIPQGPPGQQPPMPQGGPPSG